VYNLILINFSEIILIMLVRQLFELLVVVITYKPREDLYTVTRTINKLMSVYRRIHNIKYVRYKICFLYHFTLSYL